MNKLNLFYFLMFWFFFIIKHDNFQQELEVVVFILSCLGHKTLK